MIEDHLDRLYAARLLTEDEVEFALTSHQTFGGTLLRVLERITTRPSALWIKLAEYTGRACVTNLNALETLEEAVTAPGTTTLEALISRDLAVQTLSVGLRTEGEKLCLASPDFLLDLDDEDLVARANTVSLLGEGHLQCTVLPPDLYRQCVRLAYPTALYGPLTLTQRMAILALVPERFLLHLRGQEHEAIQRGLLSEDDYAEALAAHLQLQVYQHAPLQLGGRPLPDETLRQNHVFPVVYDPATSRLTLLTATEPSPELTLQFERLSGTRVSYQVTTATVIRSLL